MGAEVRVTAERLGTALKVLGAPHPLHAPAVRNQPPLKHTRDASRLKNLISLSFCASKCVQTIVFVNQDTLHNAQGRTWRQRLEIENCL